MPTYQYACTSCGEQLEAVQRFSDDPLTVCPACGGVLRKVFSPVGIVFKGSGFYRTDSRNGPVLAKDGPAKEGPAPDKPAQDKTAKSNGDGGSSAKKADAKPAAGSAKSGTKPAAAAAST